MTSAQKNLNTAFLDMRHWLFEQALPLWWDTVADRQNGGFFELLDQGGKVIEVPRRTRLVGRQVYSYAKAYSLGWDGPAKEIVAHGIDFLLSRSLAENGIFFSSVTPAGEPINPHYDLYDQAFALFGLATALSAYEDAPKLRKIARDVRVRLIAGWKHPVSGFEESMPRTLPLKANPHMHMFEASLAWIEVGPDAGDNGWGLLSDEIAELCLRRFLHPSSGALLELFDADWSPSQEKAERFIEPGHQFEWAWLLKRWGLLRGRNDAIKAARRLTELAETHGVDRKTGLVVNTLNEDFLVYDSDSRLWPQTERIKAWLAMADLAEDATVRAQAYDKAALAVRGLMKYFSGTVSGSWHETLRPDGTPVLAPARASSLYHIVCAFGELDEAIRTMKV